MKTITHAQYDEIVDLLAKANDFGEKISNIEFEVADIVGLDQYQDSYNDENSWVFDTVWNGYTLDQMLQNLGIEVKN
jgi:hypothetical protein